MNMKEHILAALREQFDRWELLLMSLSEEQINAVWRLKAQSRGFRIKLCFEFMSLKAFSWQTSSKHFHKEQSWNTALRNKE